jgi:hypothetical protein
MRHDNNRLNPSDAGNVTICRLNGAKVLTNQLPMAEYFSVSVPELNEFASTFAYFKSQADAEYVLFIMIYDTAGNLTGKSTEFRFPDNAGNIIFTAPVSSKNRLPSFIINNNFSSNFSAVTFLVAIIDSGSRGIKSVAIDIGTTGTFTDITELKNTGTCTPGFNCLSDESINEFLSDTIGYAFI